MKRFFTLFTALFLMGSMMVVQAADYYVAGTMNGWNPGHDDYKMNLVSGTVYSKTLTALGANDYEFKITNGSWSQNWGSGDMDNTQSNVTLSDNGGNIKFTLSTTSDVTFYFNSGSEKMVYVQATPVSNPSASFTIPSGTVVYYDFTAYKSGINVYAPCGLDDWHSSTTDVISITLNSDWEITASTNLFKSEASGWSFVTGTILPTEGQNMIVSTDGVTYSWGTYVPSSDPGQDPGEDPGQDPEPSYTFPNGTTIYYDFTAYKSGINVYAPCGLDDWHSSTTDVISITLNSDWEISASTNLFKSAASSWSFVTGTILPTEGQNMIVSTDGVNYTWGTYVPSSDPGQDPGEDPGQDPEPSYTFPNGTTIYYDFTAYKSGINVYAPCGLDDWHSSTTDVISITLNSDWEISASTNLFKSAASNWSFVTGTILPTEGQNMIVSTDGVTYSWGTYVPSSDPGQDPEPTVTTITIKGKVPAEWTNAIYVYLYSTDADGFHPATQEGEWWSYTYTGASTSINAIFVNGDDWNGLPAYYQTVDITGISADTCYELTYHTGAKATYVGVDCPSTPEPPVVLGVRLNGDFETPGTWMDTEIFTGDDESVSLKMNLVEGNYVFGLVINDVMFVNGAAFTRENPSAEITDGNNELTFDADVDGEYTFTWTFASNTLSIDYPAAVTPEYATIKFFAPRDQTNKWDHVYAYATKGNKKDFGPKPGTEITDKDAEWYVVTVRKGSNLLFTDDANMETEVIENIQEDACYVSTAINYNVTPKIVSLTKQCNVDYYVAGDEGFTGNNWDPANAACKFDENNQMVFHDVPAGSYQFKITNGSWAWSIGGDDFLSDEPGCGTIASEVDLGNTGFTIDEKQDVTITYDPATRKICLGALTVKTVGTLTASDINLYVDETKYPSYTTNIEGYTAADVELTFVSGDACVEFVEGQIKGTAEGTAVVRVTIAETALFTSATDEFTVTVSAVPVPPTPSEDWVEVRSGLEAGRHYTVCLENNVTAVKGATFWSLTYRNEGGTAAYLVEETAPFDAGKPYIFCATNDNDGKLEVVYGTELAINPVVNGALRGTFSYMDGDALAGVEGTVYMLYNNALCPMGPNNHLDAHRAYVRYDLLQEAPAQGFAPGKRVKSMPMQGQTTTGIDALNASEAPVKMIIDGNLYILRGEKMYDATGRLVK